MINIRGVRAVVFDFDGTLAVLNIDFSEMKKRILSLLVNFSVDTMWLREKYLLEIIEEAYSLLLPEGREMAERFYSQSHRILREVEIEAAGRARLIEGVRPALSFLAERGIKIGIVTRNCEEAVRRVFADIDSFCDIFISRDATRKVKPHPDHVGSVLRALDIPGREAMMVGDHVIDIEAGKRLDMITAGVLTGRTGVQEFEMARADLVLKDVTEVARLFEF